MSAVNRIELFILPHTDKQRIVFMVSTTWISFYGFQPYVVRESSSFYFYRSSNRERTFNTRTYKAAAHKGIMQIPSTSLEVNLLAKKYTGTNKIKKQQIRQPKPPMT